MPDKLKAKGFTIFFLKVTHINEALFWCFRFNTNLQFSIMSRNAKKSFPIPREYTGNSDAIDDVRDYL